MDFFCSIQLWVLFKEISNHFYQVFLWQLYKVKNRENTQCVFCWLDFYQGNFLPMGFWRKKFSNLKKICGLKIICKRKISDETLYEVTFPDGTFICCDFFPYGFIPDGFSPVGCYFELIFSYRNFSGKNFPRFEFRKPPFTETLLTLCDSWWFSGWGF